MRDCLESSGHVKKATRTFSTMTGGLTALFDIAVVINYATGYERAIWLLKQ